MLSHRELTAMPEWRLIAERLGDWFAEHTTRALNEQKDIGEVRYHKGWVDAINEFIDLPRELFPDETREEVLDENVERGESFITLKKDGSVY